MKNLYELLGVPNFSPVEVLKIRYHELARQWHPDKQIQSNSNNEPTSEEFQIILEAWKLLKDDKQKKDYDLSLNEFLISESNYFLHDSFTLTECNDLWSIESIDNVDMLVYDCRCGGTFMLEKSALLTWIGIHIPCDSCSLHVKITAD